MSFVSRTVIKTTAVEFDEGSTTSDACAITRTKQKKKKAVVPKVIETFNGYDYEYDILLQLLSEVLRRDIFRDIQYIILGL